MKEIPVSNCERNFINKCIEEETVSTFSVNLLDNNSHNF